MGIGRGQEGVAASIYLLPARGTIEQNLIRILEAKAKTLDAVLDGGKDSGLDIYSQLLEELRKAG